MVPSSVNCRSVLSSSRSAAISLAIRAVSSSAAAGRGAAAAPSESAARLRSTVPSTPPSSSVLRLTTAHLPLGTIATRGPILLSNSLPPAMTLGQLVVQAGVADWRAKHRWPDLRRLSQDEIQRPLAFVSDQRER